MTSLLVFPISLAISCTLIPGILPPDLSVQLFWDPPHLPSVSQRLSPDFHPGVQGMLGILSRWLSQELPSLQKSNRVPCNRCTYLKTFFSYCRKLLPPPAPGTLSRS